MHKRTISGLLNQISQLGPQFKFLTLEHLPLKDGLIVQELCRIFQTLPCLTWFYISFTKMSDETKLMQYVIKSMQNMPCSDFLKDFAWFNSGQSFTKSTIPLAEAVNELPSLNSISLSISETDKQSSEFLSLERQYESKGRKIYTTRML